MLMTMGSMTRWRNGCLGEGCLGCTGESCSLRRESTECPRLAVVAFSGPEVDRRGHRLPLSLLNRSLSQLSGYPRLILLPMTGRDNFFHRVEKLREFVRQQCLSTIVLHIDCYDVG